MLTVSFPEFGDAVLSIAAESLGTISHHFQAENGHRYAVEPVREALARIDDDRTVKLVFAAPMTIHRVSYRLTATVYVRDQGDPSVSFYGEPYLTPKALAFLERGFAKIQEAMALTAIEKLPELRAIRRRQVIEAARLRLIHMGQNITKALAELPSA